jgi:hypothetical protein
MRYAIYLILALVLIQAAYSSSIESSLIISPDTYTKGEIVKITLNLKNSLQSSQEVVIDVSVSSETSSYVHLSQPISVTMQSGKSKQITVYTRKIDDNFQEGTYNVKTRINSETETTSLEGMFNIKNTLKKIELGLDICKDKACKSKTTVFSSKETVYLLPKENTDGTMLNSFITYPNGKIEKIQLPGEFIPSMIGTYQVNILATKEGYEDFKSSYDFGVIDSVTKIVETKICDANAVCSTSENHQNCPVDCLSGKKDNFCDRESDSKCDPDCKKEEDIDCIAPSPKIDNSQNDTSPKNIVLILIAIVIIAACVIYFIKRKND